MRYWKRGLGIGLIFIGFFICLTARVITGGVVGFKSENLLGLLGILMLVVGIVLVFVEREKKDLGTVVERESKKIHSIAEAADKEKLGSYLAGKRIIFDTDVKGGRGCYEHTQFIGRGISEVDFLKQIGGKKSQYSPQYTLEEIRRYEERVARKGRGYLSDSSGSENKAIVYGISDKRRYGPTGAYKPKGAKTGRAIFGIAVELQEKPDGIHIHGYPVPEGDIPKEIRKKIYRGHHKNHLK